jgi:uncharacterized membrane protein
MGLIGIGALLVIAGMVVATLSTLRRGKLSQAEEPLTHEPRDTLEPIGRGRRLNLKADLPGFALILIGIVLMALGAR